MEFRLIFAEFDYTLSKVQEQVYCEMDTIDANRIFKNLARFVLK